MNSSFSGFPPEGIQFLADLAANNNREWFQDNKNTYEEQLLKPAQLFVLALGERLQEISGAIRYDTATNGTGSLMRIYCQVAPVNVPGSCGHNVPAMCTNNVPPMCGQNAPHAG